MKGREGWIPSDHERRYTFKKGGSEGRKETIFFLLDSLRVEIEGAPFSSCVRWGNNLKLRLCCEGDYDCLAVNLKHTPPLQRLIFTQYRLPVILQPLSPLVIATTTNQQIWHSPQKSRTRSCARGWRGHQDTRRKWAVANADRVPSDHSEPTQPSSAVAQDYLPSNAPTTPSPVR